MKESQIKRKIEQDLEKKYPNFRVSLKDAAAELGISYHTLSRDQHIPRFHYGTGKCIRTDELAKEICRRMLITS